MTRLRVALAPRDVPARLHATCSDVSLDVNLDYETGPPASGTDIQRRIEALVQLPSSAWLVDIGGLELCFSHEGRLSSLSLYANFAAAAPEDLVPLSGAPPVWITLPEVDPAEDDNFSVDAEVSVSVDRQRGAVQLRLPGQDHRAYSLADGLVAWVDAAGCLVRLVAHGIEWTVSTPVQNSRP